jgi:hypothetical protein
MDSMKHQALFLLAAVAAIAAACADSNGSDDSGTPSGELNVLRLPPTAPPLCSDSVSALFTKRNTGGPQEIALQFGTPFNLGDTITITVKWVGSDSVLFEMRPTGLKFSPTAMARLRIQYDECHGDFNDDGQDDDDDAEAEANFQVFRQENPGEDFFPVGTLVVKDEDRIDADLPGFSRYMIAY